MDGLDLVDVARKERRNDFQPVLLSHCFGVAHVIQGALEQPAGSSQSTKWYEMQVEIVAPLKIQNAIVINCGSFESTDGNCNCGSSQSTDRNCSSYGLSQRTECTCNCGPSQNTEGNCRASSQNTCCNSNNCGASGLPACQPARATSQGQ